jgi:hypothetical protein
VFAFAKSQTNTTDSIFRSVSTIPSPMDYSEQNSIQPNDKLEQKAIKYDMRKEIGVEKIAAQKKQTYEKNKNDSLVNKKEKSSDANKQKKTK